MDEELKTLLKLMAIAIPVGLLIGIGVRKIRPAWSKAYTKFCLDGKWWIYLVGTFVAAGCAVVSFLLGRPYLGGFFLLFTILEAFAFFKYGFRHLTAEEEARIDKADPTRLWPISSWKQETDNTEPTVEDSEKPGS